MSSTARGGKRSEADNYPTPSWCVRRLLEIVTLPKEGNYLEPAAGDGAIVRAADSMDPGLGGVEPPIRWWLHELREECRKDLDTLGYVEIGDFLHDGHGGQPGTFDVCITNPPFSLAMEFIRVCLPISDHAIFLLRLNFLGSEERSKFIRETMPDIYVLPNRPSFTGGHTDSIEYAWFHWHKNSRGIYKILASTPIEERRHDANEYAKRTQAHRPSQAGGRAFQEACEVRGIGTGPLWEEVGETEDNEDLEEDDKAGHPKEGGAR